MSEFVSNFFAMPPYHEYTGHFFRSLIVKGRKQLLHSLFLLLGFHDSGVTKA